VFRGRACLGRLRLLPLSEKTRPQHTPTCDRGGRHCSCRFFAGFSEEETAAALDTSVRTVQRDWMRARAWLKEELGGGGEQPV